MSSLINFPHIASMAFNTPLYATQDVVSTVKAFLEPRILGKSPDVRLDPIYPDAPALSVDDWDERAISVSGKIAVIKVHGILAPRRGAIDNTCTELKSYEQLRNQIRLALDNELVEEIVLDFHTGGGAAMGCKELADFIYQSRQIKKITAIVNFAAYSAGYFLAAACSRIICSPSGGVGSIGVRMETVDLSKLEEAAGIKYNTFFRGGHKNNYSPHEQSPYQPTVDSICR
jgi:ClpP class serine protease